jgi:POT family proton-dependent oligopeptide transporter
MMAGLVFIFFSIIFWAFFEQSGGSLSLFAANNLDNTVLGIPLDPNGVNNSANSLFVIMFAALTRYRMDLAGKRKMEPNTLIKFGMAFIFLAGGFYIFYSTRLFADANGVTSLDLFTFGWLVITFGELCLSPIGMSIMTKLAPQKLQAIMMGMWFLASAYGQYFAGILGANISDASENADNYNKLDMPILMVTNSWPFMLWSQVSCLIAISPFVRKLMQEVK